MLSKILEISPLESGKKISDVYDMPQFFYASLEFMARKVISSISEKDLWYIDRYFAQLENHEVHILKSYFKIDHLWNNKYINRHVIKIRSV